MKALALRLLTAAEQALARARIRLGAPSGEAPAEAPDEYVVRCAPIYPISQLERALGLSGLGTPKQRRAEILRVLHELRERSAPAAPAPAPAAPDPAAAAAPAAPTSCGLAPRVLDLLSEIKFDPAEFRRSGSPCNPQLKRTIAARRAVVAKLRSEGLTIRQIAEACCIDPKTVQKHLYARKTGGAS